MTERRARLGCRHGLARGHGAADPTSLAHRLVAIHATDPASVYLAAWARVDGVTPADVADALYEQRTLMRMLGMRRTMFVVPTELVPVVQHSSTDAVAARMRRALLAYVATVVPEPEGWLRELEDDVAALLAERGDATGLELSRDEPRLRTRIAYAEDKSYGGEMSITPLVLNLMSAEGRIVRGRPDGAWNSSRYRWSPSERWLPAGLPSLPADDAREALLRRWLHAFGPGTVADLKWWTGWNLGDVRRTLERIDTVEVDLDGEVGLLLAADADAVEPPEPWVALLPSLDSTPMGWKGRDWYLPEAHRAELFDRSGNVGPTVWCDGRVVGGWAQRKDGEIVWRLLEEVGSDHEREIERSAERLTAWIGDVRITPRFGTPLEKALRSQPAP